MSTMRKGQLTFEEISQRIIILEQYRIAIEKDKHNLQMICPHTKTENENEDENNMVFCRGCLASMMAIKILENVENVKTEDV